VRTAALRELRRPIILASLSAICLALQHVLLRMMAHGHVAHVLLGAGNTSPKTGAAALAIALLVVRFVSYILVPGLVLAAGAEAIAYLLVGPRGLTAEEEEEATDPEPPSV
jgi:hypothetical protein